MAMALATSIIAGNFPANLTYAEANVIDKLNSVLEESAEVIWDLVCLNKEKTLNATEKKMLTNARKFLTGEMALIKKISEDEANELLDTCIS